VPRIVRRGSGPVVTWRRAQMVLPSAQGMDVAAIAKVAFTSEDRVRDVIGNFNGHQEQASMTRRYIIWRNNHADDERLRHVVAQANVA